VFAAGTSSDALFRVVGVGFCGLDLWDDKDE
jgi:hypothetical protein